MSYSPLKKKKKKKRGEKKYRRNEWTNTLPKPSQARKKPTTKACTDGLWPPPSPPNNRTHGQSLYRRALATTITTQQQNSWPKPVQTGFGHHHHHPSTELMAKAECAVTLPQRLKRTVQFTFTEDHTVRLLLLTRTQALYPDDRLTSDGDCSNKSVTDVTPQPQCRRASLVVTVS